MGCGASRGARVDADQPATLPANGSGSDPLYNGNDKEAQKKASKNARNRRLSTPTVKGALSSDAPGKGVPVGQKPDAKGARARRLSYVGQKKNGQQVDGAQHMSGTTTEPQEEITGGSGGFRCHGACVTRTGQEGDAKKINQDSCFAFERYLTDDQSLFGAFDGHGPCGHLVSGFVKKQLPASLAQLSGSIPEPRQLLMETYAQVDRALNSSQVDCEFSGTTAVVMYAKGSQFTVAWVGDSRAVLGTADPSSDRVVAVDLTRDHKPGDPKERSRIEACGGRVEQLVDEDGQRVGPERIWMPYAWIPGLAMSRALGDSLAHQIGVTSTPEVTHAEIGERDQFAVLATDGVWEFISSQEAVDVVVAAGSPEQACKDLVALAHKRWEEQEEEDGVVDDITAVVVWFRPLEVRDGVAPVG